MAGACRQPVLVLLCSDHNRLCSAFSYTQTPSCFCSSKLTVVGKHMQFIGKYMQLQCTTSAVCAAPSPDRWCRPSEARFRQFSCDKRMYLGGAIGCLEHKGSTGTAVPCIISCTSLCHATFLYQRTNVSSLIRYKAKLVPKQLYTVEEAHTDSAVCFEGMTPA